MGHSEMVKATNQSNQDSASYSRKEEVKPVQPSHLTKATRAQDAEHGLSSALVDSVWSSDGLVTTNRLYQRSSSIVPAHAKGNQRRLSAETNPATKYELTRLTMSVSVEENNQDEVTRDAERHDLVAPIGKQMPRSWSAPPDPDNGGNVFPRTSLEPESHHLSLLDLNCTDGVGDVTASKRSDWSLHGDFSSAAIETSDVATVSPMESPVTSEEIKPDSTFEDHPKVSFSRNGIFSGDSHHELDGSFMSLVDRVQGDFPRTPSPVFGSSTTTMEEQMLMDGMKHLQFSDSTRHRPSASQPRANPHRQDHIFVPADHLGRRHLHRTHSQRSYPTSAYPIVAPPGFQAPVGHGIYGSPTLGDHRRGWIQGDTIRGVPVSPYSVVPVGFGHTDASSRNSFKGSHIYHRKYGGIYEQPEICGRYFSASPVYPTQTTGYGVQDHQLYDISPTSSMFPAKVAPNRRHGMPHLNPVAHTYSSTTLLEEFKTASKADKWDLTTIQGHLLQFARDQSGSRFIQQKLEKADERTRSEAFEEIFPQALMLMADVFGNYVIQKFFDHGTVDQHRRLVGLLKENMVSLALQVYGCRVIQKALEVTRVEEQQVLIRELKGHVLQCVIDQNGNHVLQKCIEAASWKRTTAKPSVAHREVTGEDVQFIVDDFIGQAAALSTHSYGCRVIQRVLEHCSPRQIRPIVSEIIVKARELVKDQFGNYVVQHVIVHGELDQRNTVMQTIFPEIAKWSQHKYASNVVEACLERATKSEIGQIIDFILQCDDSGSSCALLTMMKHMYGNYVVQKLLDKADQADRQRIVCIILHNADYLRRFTYGKHVLSRLERDSKTQFY